MVKVIVTVQGKKTAEVSLDREMIVGRREDADLRLPYSEVSSRHAKIRPDGKGMVICDLGSTNGTYLDGKTRIDPQTDVPMAPGARVSIGPAVLEVEAPAAAPPPRPAAPQRDPGGHGTVLVGTLDAKSALVDMAMFQAAAAKLVVAAQDGRRTVALDKMETTLGREEGEVKIAHPSVSTEHARLSFQGGRFFVEDLGSSNGTFVDGTPVTGKAPLPSQSVLTLGTVPCLLVYTEAKKAGSGTEDVPAGPLLSHLVQIGKLTQVEADRALAAHRDQNRSLGEVLVADGAWTAA